MLRFWGCSVKYGNLKSLGKIVSGFERFLCCFLNMNPEEENV
jgi:hypothetical protein